MDHVMAVVEQAVGEGTGVNREEAKVGDCVAGRDVGRRIGMVCIGVKDTATVDNGGDVVSLAEAVKERIRDDGKVGTVKAVGVVDGQDDEAKEKGTAEEVDGAEDGGDEWLDVGGENGPVKCWKRVKAQARRRPGEDTNGLTLGRNPSHPAEDGESCEEISRHPEPAKHGEKSKRKEFEARHGPHLVEGAGNGRIFIRMKCRIEGDSDEGQRPGAEGRVDKEAAAKASQAIADEVGGQSDEKLVTHALGPGLIEEPGEVLNPYDVVCVGLTDGDGGHERHEHVLFLVKGAWVKAMSNAKESKTAIREGLFQELANWIG